MGVVGVLCLLALSGATPGEDDPWTRARTARTPRDGVVALVRAQPAFLDATAEDQRALAAAADDARTALVRGLASYQLARWRARGGQIEDARARDAAAGVVRDAWLLGPLSSDGGVRDDAPLPVEGRPFDPQAHVLGAGREVGFTRVELAPAAGVFEVDAHLSPSRDVGALLLFTLVVERPTEVALRVGSDSGVAVRVAGAEVLRFEGARAARPDQTAALFRLGAGAHQVVVRLWDEGGGVSTVVRLTDAAGAPLDGVRASAAPADLARARAAGGVGVAAGPLVDVVAELSSAAEREDATAATLRDAAALQRALRFADARAPRAAEERWWTRALALEDEPGTRLALAEWLAGRDPTRARELLLPLAERDARAAAALATLLGQLGLPRDAVRWAALSRSLEGADDESARRALDVLRVHGALRVVRDREAMAWAEASERPSAALFAADVARERGDTEAAHAWLARLAEHAPTHPAWVRAEADRLVRAQVGGDAAAASALRALWGRRLAVRPADHRVARELAAHLLHEEGAPAARAFASARAARYPGRIEPLELLAELALLAGDRDGARAALRAALAIRPQERAVAGLFRALAPDEEGLPERYGLVPDELDLSRVPAGARDAGAHVVAAVTAVRFHDNGLGEVLTDQLIRVHDPRRVEGLGTFHVAFAEGRELVEVLRAERHTRRGAVLPARRIGEVGPDGKQGGVYSDVRYKVIELGELAAGDLLRVSTRKHMVGMQNLFGDFFGHIAPIHGTLPSLSWRFVVEGPKTRELSWGGRGVPEPLVRERGDVSVWDFSRVDVPRLAPEPAMPPWLEVADYVSVSTYGDWAALGAWYWQLVDAQLALDDELRALAARLGEGATTTPEKVRRVYEHVVTATRYVGIELGIHGWKPYPVTEVYRRRYGDCKDKASLLVALLGALDIPARLVLVRTADNGVLDEEPASMWAFNHAIAWVPELDLFLDGTAERSGVGELPDLDQGAMALIVEPPASERRSRLVRIPLASAEENRNVSSYVLTVSPDGDVAIDGRERFRGAAAADERRSLEDEATRKEQLERTLGSILPGARVAEVTTTDLSLGAAELGYDFRGVLPERAQPDDAGGLVLPISLYPHALVAGYAERSRRDLPVWLNHPWQTTNRMRYVLPDGWAAPDLPKTREIATEHFRFVQRVERTDDGFLVEEDTALLSREVPPADYAAFRRALVEAEEVMKRKVRLVREAG